MSFKSLQIFSNKEDLLPILTALESKFGCTYTLCKTYSWNSSPTCYQFARDIPHLSEAEFGDSIRESAYLATSQDKKISTSLLLRMSGKVERSIDLARNPNSLYIQPGGIFQRDVLISGRLSYVSNNVVAREMFLAATKQIKKTFFKIHSFYVSPFGVEMLRKGLRLTQDVRSPVLYDLREE